MQRNSLGFRLKYEPLLAKLLHECWCCHAVGLKPGVLATHLGDYGMRDFLRGQYEELHLSPDGLCSRCLATSPLEAEGSVQR